RRNRQRTEDAEEHAERSTAGFIHMNRDRQGCRYRREQEEPRTPEPAAVPRPPFRVHQNQANQEEQPEIERAPQTFRRERRARFRGQQQSRREEEKSFAERQQNREDPKQKWIAESGPPRIGHD